MKKTFLFLSLLAVVSLACGFTFTMTDPTSIPTLPNDAVVPTGISPTQVPAASPTSVLPTLPPDPPATAQPPASDPTVTFGPLTFNIPAGLASGITGRQLARADGQDLPYWSKTPGHWQITLDAYPLQGKTHEPGIYIYPGLDYATISPAAFEAIHRLDNILYGPGGPINLDQLPAVPFFNAQQAFASRVQVISFQNGSGVRFLTEYAQYAVSANNNDLFYHFEGLSRDGTYYIVAILPVSVPVLAETSDAGAPLPPGGIPYSYFANPNADMKAYYASVTDLLNNTSPDAFTPTIAQLDSLIESMRTSP